MKLALQLALPAILAQLTTILMEYADAAMVGHLGAEASAAIGLVSTTTWLMGGVCSSLCAGFAVMVAHRVGARDNIGARAILRQSVLFSAILSVAISLVGVIISPFLPYWLGGSDEICHDATIYYLIYSLTLPVWSISYNMAAMLRSAGNTRIPAAVNIAACILNVAFNYLLIFHAHMGVMGAALGTSASAVIASAVMVYYVYYRCDILSPLQEQGSYRLQESTVSQAMHISIPMAIEHAAMCSAHIMSTIIVAPLGTAAIAANAFGIIIEGLCYMPGYGIGDAATTLVGQSIGAKRPRMQRSFGYISLCLGIGFMTIMGILMYVGIPYLMPLMTSDVSVQQLTVSILRIEAFAEPFYAASIVAYAIFVGAGDTKVPCVMNLSSIWLIRIPLAIILVKKFGLQGFWIAMAIELGVRGLIFLVRLFVKNHKLKLQYASHQ